MMKRICLLVLLLPFGLWAQTSKVRGQVTDATDGSPIPYASVFFDGTSIGVSTDEDGRYYIETRDSNALVLTAQMLGYVLFAQSLMSNRCSHSCSDCSASWRDMPLSRPR